MKAKDLAERPLEWVDKKGGPSDVAISSRIRLARNLERYPFPPHSSEETLKEVASHVKEAVSRVSYFRGSAIYEVEDLDVLSRQVLLEKRLISAEFAAHEAGRLLVLDERGAISTMVNEEDHLRIQIILPGLDLDDVWSIARVAEEGLQRLGYAYDQTLGYLTSCPTNTGTGMRASVMLHIPALEMTRQIGKIVRECNRVGLTVRGAYGEGSESQGSLYQVSNQVTLGLSEEELADKVGNVAMQLVRQEEEARERLFESLGIALEDQIWRAVGKLKHARIVSFGEALEALSLIRMGSDLGILPKVEPHVWKKWLVSIQPGHVQALSGHVMEMVQANLERARILREVFADF